MTLVNQGALTVGVGVTLNVPGLTSSAGTITNNGRVLVSDFTQDAGTTSPNGIEFVSGGVFHRVGAGAVHVLVPDGQFLQFDGSVLGAGQTLDLAGSQMYLLQNLTNNSSIMLEGSGRSLINLNSFTLSNAGTLSVLAGGPREIGIGTVINSATLDIETDTNTNNLFTTPMTLMQTTTGRLHTTINAAGPSGHLATSAADLAGTLSVTTVGSPAGPGYDVVTGGQINGRFSTLDYGSQQYETTYSGTAVTLSLPGNYNFGDLSLNSRRSAATGVTYTLSLEGPALTGGNSILTLTAPSGTVFPVAAGCGNYTFSDTTSGRSSACVTVTGGGSNIVNITAPSSSALRDHIVLTVTGVTNASPNGGYPLTLTSGADSLPLGFVLDGTAGFVRRSGTTLLLDGQPYRFTGINMYDANNRAGCGTVLSDADLAAAFDSIGPGRVVRAWFFQSLATSGGQRDWTGFDRTVTLAASHGIKLIPTLVNQWPDCDGPSGSAGVYKTRQWYDTGYRSEVLSGTIVSYRAWVAEVVARYSNDPTIAAWQLVNEAEVYTAQGAGCPDPTGAGIVLHDFAADVSALVKSTDPNHLVSLGVIGSGQCGADNDNYRLVHSVPGVDLCEFHDYSFPNVAMVGDRWNGLAERIRQCRLLNKPLFVGESGIKLPEAGGSPTTRAEKFAMKMEMEFRVGVVGYVAWAWQQTPSPLTYDIGPGDPVLATLAQQFPDDGGDSDGDGVTNAVDAGAGFDDHAGTLGSVVNAFGQYVVIMDAPAPAGVRVYIATACCGQPPAELSLCGANQTLPAGTDIVLTCPRRLNVTVLGSGQGTVTSSPEGVTMCSTTCAAEFPHGTSVTLTASADLGSRFAGWSGPAGGSCSGTDCVVTMDALKDVTATFIKVWPLTVTKTGTGTGTVTSNPINISCGPTCSASFDQDTSVTLTASADLGSRFAGWSGRDAKFCPDAAGCTVTISTARSVTATFVHPGTWASSEPMSTARSNQTATRLLDGSVLVVGGVSGSRLASLGKAEVFDSQFGTWASTGNVTNRSSGHTATLLPGGGVLVAGGTAGSTVVAQADLYNAASKTWSAARPMTSARSGHTATLLGNGTILVAGGYTGGAVTNTAEIYNPSTGLWIRVGSMLTARTGHTATLLANGTVLVTGGTSGGSAALASAELYDPSARVWTPVRTLMASPLVGHTATRLLDGRVLIAGGTAAIGGSPRPSVILYNPQTKTWSSAASMAVPRTGHTATLLSDGRVLVTGGTRGVGPTSTAEMYTVSTGAWTTTGSMAGPRTTHTATLLTNGTVLITGGNSGTGVLATTQTFWP